MPKQHYGWFKGVIGAQSYSNINRRRSTWGMPVMRDGCKMRLRNLTNILLQAIVYTFLLGSIAIAQAQANLAPDGTATQSSTRPAGGAAIRAIDGNIDGQFFNNSVTHTGNDPQPWWEVDLGNIADITSINLYNRTDCCANRATNYHVFVSDVPFVGTTVAASQAQLGVLDLFDPGQIGRPTTRMVNRTGRYVRVQKAGGGNLSLAEVQVFGSRSPEIDITSSESGAVADGDTDAQGTEPAGTAKTVTYTVDNTGTDTLTLTGTPTVSGETNITGAVTVTAPASLILAPGASTTFTVTYTPTIAGAFSFDMDVASDDADEGTYDIAVSGTGNAPPTVVLTGPAGAIGGPFTVTATFSEPVTGLALADFIVGNGTASGLVMISPSVYTLLITPTTQGTAVTVSLPANIAMDADSAMNEASNVLNIASGALTDAEREEIRDIIIQEAVRTLRSELSANQRAVRDARDRHAAAQRCRALEIALENGRTTLEHLEDGCSANPVTRNNVPLSFNGTLHATQDSTDIRGSFFGQSGSQDRSRNRLVFGEFDLTRHEDGDVTASFNGRVAWEQLVSDDVLFGYFLGATASQSDLAGNFSGSRLGYGLTAGAYFVDQLDTNLFWDGFAAVSFGQNNLDLGNGTVNVGSDYATTSLQLGLAVSGIKEYDRFELRPELSIAYGYTQIGDVDLTVSTAASSLNDVVSAGNVSLGTISFTPEFIFPLSPNGQMYDYSEFRVMPSLTCEYIKTTTSNSDCGGGLELGWSASSDDGLRKFSARISREVIGGSTRDSLGLQFQSEF